MSVMRGAESIGSGLAPARQARPIRRHERIHVVGAAGAGASAAALLAHAAGAIVTGCDAGGASPYTPPIEAAGIHLDWSHQAEHVRGQVPPDRLSVTKALTAIDPDNPELAAARAAGIPLEPWQQVIADAAVGRQLVAVAGTHGKSTSSGWLVHVLAACGADPSAFVGALMPGALTGGLPSTARLGSGRQFVVEADEYAGNFDPYRPNVAILTSAEWDHPDVFANVEAVIDCFHGWLLGSEVDPFGHPPVIVANVADPGVAEVAARLRNWPGQLWVTALWAGSPEAGLRVAEELEEQYATADGPARALIGRVVEAGPTGTTVELGTSQLPEPLTARLRLAGRHNASNGLGVAAAAILLGLGGDELSEGLGSFRGVGRRLERKGEGRGVVVFDDYGHHPTAIRETLAAVRQIEPERRIWAVYEPLTYHRTAAMLGPFAEVLASADAVVVADIWASRDPDTHITSAAALAEAVARRNPNIPVAAPGSVEVTAEWLAREVRPGDAVLVMGGGKSYRIAELLLEALRR
jgi:UDP-N-acetylmuramate--alanine ligase